jgi:hypothetical protein
MSKVARTFIAEYETGAVVPLPPITTFGGVASSANMVKIRNRSARTGFSLALVGDILAITNAQIKYTWTS